MLLEKKYKKADIMVMSKGKALIFSGGLGPEYKRVEKLLDESGIIVAADSGWDLAVSMYITPDYYIGDLDSISDKKSLELIPEERKLIFPPDKDYTDTDLAIKFVEDKDYRDIVLIGGGGGRIDHLIALTTLFNRDIKPLEWYTAEERIVYTARNSSFSSRRGQTISLFACYGGEGVVSTEGLQWELENFKLDSSSFSLSNTALADNIEVRVHSGAALVIFNY